MSIQNDQKPIQVFWPLDDPRQAGDATTYFYGWRLSDTHVVVAGQLPSSAVTSEGNGWEAAFSELVRDVGLGDYCILGKGSPQSSNGLELLQSAGSPRRINFVFYKRPNPRHLRFYSLDPLQLDVSTEGAQSANASDMYSSIYHQLEATDFTRPRNRPPATLEDVISKLNCAYEAGRRITSAYVKGKMRTVTKEAVISGPLGRKHESLSYLLLVPRFLLGICNLRLPSLFVHKPLLKDISATVQQLDTRLEQATFLPNQFYVVHRSPRTDMAYSAAQYINFYNCIWLVLNDIIVGVAAGAFLSENATYLGHLLLYYTKMYAVDLIRDTLFWLDDWPVGLKLNTELSRFICLSFVGLTGAFEDCLDIIGPYFPTIIWVIGSSGTLGLTMTLSLLSDLLSLLTLPLYFCYMTATTVFRSQLSAAYSLFNVFRGKRKNILRNRVDSMEYDLDQVLLGTILFTLVAFLFPTILAYYAFFATARIAVIMVHAMLETSLAFMNHFPLFVLMLRVKDPARLPGGIHFDILPAKGHIPVSLLLKNTPIAFSQIFFQHFLLWSRLSAHYHPLRLLKCLVSGIVISPIPRYSIRYSMIPQQDDAGEWG